MNKDRVSHLGGKDLAKIVTAGLFALNIAVTYDLKAQRPTPSPTPRPELTPEATPEITPEVLPDDIAIQMTAEELRSLQYDKDGEVADYINGVKMMINGKQWEFVSDIPDMPFDSDFDMSVLTERIDRLMLNNPDVTQYRSPSTPKIRISFTYNRDLLHDEDVLISLNNEYGIKRGFIAEDGSFVLDIPYNDNFLNKVKTNKTTLSNEQWSGGFNFMAYQAMFFAPRINPSNTFKEEGFVNPLYEHFNLSPQASYEEFLQVFKGIKVKAN